MIFSTKPKQRGPKKSFVSLSDAILSSLVCFAKTFDNTIIVYKGCLNFVTRFKSIVFQKGIVLVQYIFDMIDSRT